MRSSERPEGSHQGQAGWGRGRVKDLLYFKMELAFEITLAAVSMDRRASEAQSNREEAVTLGRDGGRGGNCFESHRGSSVDSVME